MNYYIQGGAAKADKIKAAFFEGYDDNFYCFRGAWEQCIPFNDDTKHLLGTTDPCDERFINW